MARSCAFLRLPEAFRRQARAEAETAGKRVVAVGVPDGLAQGAERGANELPIRHLLTLCRYYRVSADFILGLADARGNSLYGKPKAHLR